MRALWKGAISFGLVNIPVRLYAATERKDVKFNYLHAECGTPVRYLKWCPTCNREITQEEIVYGYEYEKGRYVTMKDEDLESLPARQARTVDIMDFVDLAEIDPIYYDKTYFLEPAEGGEKAYALLRETMEESGKIGIARVAIRSKESLACVRVYSGGVLVMETMFYPDEIRSGQALTGIHGNYPVDARELDMAKLLVKGLTAQFDATKYKSDYRAKLRELIEAKVQGQEITEAPRPEMGRVIDLMEALRRSVEAVQQDRGGAQGVVGGTPFGPAPPQMAPGPHMAPGPEPPGMREAPGPR